MCVSVCMYVCVSVCLCVCVTATSFDISAPIAIKLHTCTKYSLGKAF